MKKALPRKLVNFVILTIVLLITAFLYQQKRIFLLPSKTSVSEEEKVVLIPFTEKEYRLSYGESFSSDKVFKIANFEKNEKWSGEGEIDYVTFSEGKSSLFLNSKGGEISSSNLRLDKGFDFKKVLNFKLFINATSSIEDFELFKIIFTTASGNKYQYPISDLENGWNLLSLPAEKFSIEKLNNENGEENITGISFELTSRPKASCSLFIDYLLAETTSDYQKDWLADPRDTLSLAPNNNQPALMISKLESRAVIVKTITSAKNYNLTTQITPLAKGSFGLFLRGNSDTKFGYYLMLEGIESNGWKIYKYGNFENHNQSITLAQGSISNFETEENKNYWIKAKLSGSNISFFISMDGQNFNKLADVNDSSFANGILGLATDSSAVILLDDLYFTQ